jgi:hypothetical protein
MEIIQKSEKKPASYSHRTATTTRPCYIPVLGDSAGAGRIRLAGAQRYKKSTSKHHGHGFFKQKSHLAIARRLLMRE